MGSKLYPLLNDKEWLLKKYVEEKLSLQEVGILVGAKNHNSVRQGLQRFGIPIRNISDGLTRFRTDDFAIDHDVVEGSLLGDGFLSKYNLHSDTSYPSFDKKNKYADHVALVASTMISMSDDFICEDINNCNGKRLVYYKFSSLTRKELLPYFKRWYPELSGYVKVVPDDIELNPAVILHWFMDDGSSSFRPERTTSKQIRLCFCSESFVEKDQQRLCDQFKTKFDIDARLRPCPWGTGWRIHILQSHVQKFFDLIGPCPVPSLAYKWK